MNIKRKIKKLKLKTLTDDIRFRIVDDMGLPAERVRTFYRYDYYKMDNKGEAHMYSTEYLYVTPYREIRRGYNKSTKRTLADRLFAMRMRAGRLLGGMR